MVVNRILWPTDFSKFSLRAVRYASGLRAAFNAELHVVHVVPPPLNPDTAFVLPTDVPLTWSQPQLVSACVTGLEKLVEEQFAGDKSIRCEALLGTPWSSVCDYAARHAIDLIVITTHGRTGIRRALIGSTTESIVRHAPCPVLTIRVDEKSLSE